MSESLPAINIQFPISQEIVNGNKIIETRTYNIPKGYLNRELFIIETPGKSKFQARVIGVAKFVRSFKYESKKAFYSDKKRHLVDENSPWAWKEPKGKWGWEIQLIRKFPTPKKFIGKKGIVFSKKISIKAD